MFHEAKVYISVRNTRAYVIRQLSHDDGSEHWQLAANVPDLERAALEEVVAQGGYIIRNADYPCPADLAARAHWQPEDEFLVERV